MNEMQMIGTVITSLITIGGFVAVIVKFIQPINDLRVVIQKLNDHIDAVRTDNERLDCRITKHGEELDKLGNRVGTLETKIELNTNKK